MPYDYAIYDVFTDRALAGNPLAVVFGADGLATETMQKIAAEFNLSETVFVLPPEATGSDMRLRIFVPRGELPFAGHPTVGGAVAYCERNAVSAPKDIVIEEAVGLINCAYVPGEHGFAEFELPVLPKQEALMLPVEKAAHALGLEPSDIGFDEHQVTQWNAGKAYLCVPVKDIDALEKATFNESTWLSAFEGMSAMEVDCPYIYCRTAENDQFDVSARMFAPHHGIPEDPATGSAAASLAGALHMFDGLADGASRYVIRQGAQMGRPSTIKLTIDCKAGALTRATIGGPAVKIAEGKLYV